MDGQRFDKLARVLADGSNRRGFLKRIAAVAAGAAVVSLPGRVRAADYGDTCHYDDDCTGKYQTCYIANGYDYGTCECDEGYEPYNGHCVPVDACFKDDECNTDKHEVCRIPVAAADSAYPDYPVYGYCDCADGYTYNESKGYCWVTDSQCYAHEDCTTKYYGDYDKYVLYEGKYYSKDDYGYENPLPEYECIYGECVEVVEPEPEPEPKPEPKPEPPTYNKPPKKGDKKAVLRRRRLARLRRRRAQRRRRQNKNR